MKTRHSLWLSLFLLTIVGLGGCRAARFHGQNTLTVPDTTIPQAAGPTQDTRPQQSNSTATRTIQTAPSQVPTLALASQINAATPSADFSQAAGDLTQSLDDILKDLDTTDTLNDIQ